MPSSHKIQFKSFHFYYYHSLLSLLRFHRFVMVQYHSHALVSLLAVLLVGAPTAIWAQAPVTVQIDNSNVQVVGSSDAGVDSFLGIQYAQVGERFSRSTLQDLEDWPVWNVTSFGPNCHQSYPGLPDFILNPRASDEECLYLNIWRPSNRTSNNTPLTTMVWIHGGGLAIGSGSEEVTQGTNLARDHDVMVISLNYRLGALGFMPSEGENGSTLNGLRDQIVALEWIQTYITSFGGDPNAVTIFGESAGGESICMLSVSPLAEGLFQRAVMESGECINNDWNGGVPREDLGYGVEVVNALVNATGASSVADLSDPVLFPAAELNLVAAGVGWPVILVDGYVLPEHPSELYKDANNIVPVDFLVGSNSYEGVYFMGAPPEVYMGMAAGIESWAVGLVGEVHGKTASDAYSADDLFNGDQPAAFAQFNGDYSIRCPTREFASIAASKVPGNVYLYNFAHFSYTDPMVFFGLHEYIEDTTSWASHMAELPFVFGTLEAWDPDDPINLPVGAKDYSLSAEMQARWVAFAKTGNPNVPNFSLWEEVPDDASSTSNSATDIPVLVFHDGESQMQSVPEKVAQCSALQYGAAADAVPSAPPTTDSNDDDSSAGKTGANLVGRIASVLFLVVALIV
jgi:para-nitrobenzyl esterase